jgi:hypothetical protein
VWANICECLGPGSGVLGFLGSILLAVPYFAEIKLRKNRQEAMQFPNADIARDLVDGWTNFLLSPSGGRVKWAAIFGAAFLALGFLAVIIQTSACRGAAPTVESQRACVHAL